MSENMSKAEKIEALNKDRSFMEDGFTLLNLSLNWKDGEGGTLFKRTVEQITIKPGPDYELWRVFMEWALRIWTYGIQNAYRSCREDGESLEDWEARAAKEVEAFDALVEDNSIEFEVAKPEPRKRGERDPEASMKASVTRMKKKGDKEAMRRMLALLQAELGEE